jgi:hypothetical protein
MRFTVLLSIVGVLVTTGGCVTPMVNPEPKQFETALSPAEVVRRVTNAAVLEGFEVQVSDPVSGTLSIKRERGPKGNAAFLACNFAPGSIADENGVTVLTATISLRQSGTTAALVVNTRTITSYPSLAGTALAMPPTESACVSNGKVEELVLQAISG